MAADSEIVWKDGVTGDVTVIQTVTAPDNTWTQVTVDISAAQGNNYIGITSVVPDFFPGFTQFDLFTSTANIHLYDQDLEIKNGDLFYLAGNNVNEGFDVLIKNVGALPVLGANYTVRLM